MKYQLLTKSYKLYSIATIKKELVSACKKTIDFAVSEHNSFIYSLFIWQQEVV